MLKKLNLNFYYFWKTSWTTISIFWCIYFSFICLTLILAISFNNSSISMSGINVVPAVIFCLIFGLNFFKDSFPHLIKLGLDRYSFLLSIFIYMIAFAVVMTVISQVSSWIIKALTTVFQLDNFSYISMVDLMQNGFNQWEIFLYEFFLYLLFFGLAILIGSIFFRFGQKIGFTLLAILPALFIIKPVGLQFVKIINYIAVDNPQYHIPSLLSLSVIIGLFLWLTVSKASVIDKTISK
ncbi:hypothetical protein MUN88_21000 [Gracilibacillus caseinilyticus]|uniref:ABC-2 family transporter protein n=1 Tax=Gracilibacillus caseinilyticus TaxID=2932256 RepID=A0ABY4EXA4_9BACI|nr:hypothetical protein [Gracilibacillus caseinilyticus]UOQ48477.1 hypothetical protein MUN88_21000 [Gracilibacillus caseinilyticus]